MMKLTAVFIILVKLAIWCRGEHSMQMSKSYYTFPLKQNMRWQTITETRLLKKTGPPQRTEFRISATVPLEAGIASLSETVTMPAGTFKNCLKITMSGSTMKDAVIMLV